MKTLKLISSALVAGLAFSLVLSSCKDNNDAAPQGDILPKSFHVAIPASISNKSVTSIEGGRFARTQDDTLKGNDIYMNLNTFIAVGEIASKIVEEFIEGIRVYKIDRVVSFTYVGDDNRTKTLVVESEVSFENKTWDYALTISDVDAQGTPDGGKALQIFWNKTQLVNGIAIIKPYNCDRIKNVDAPNAVFRIDYSEGTSQTYDAQMEVRIAGLPLASPLNDPFSIGSLHMFAGKKGDVVDVYGNSSHPNAVLFSGDAGLDYAFVASGSDPKDIGVAEVGLPPSNLDNSDRNVLLKEYSITNVFTTKINELWPGIDPVVLNAYLTNTAAPGYFDNKDGFLSGGVSPGEEWDEIASRLNALTPYNPLQTANMEINFK